ncbi:TIGR02453 family protein [Hymenobacter daecheongensis DSM 21074]|uniref:TIGR02453 family protein n=1 Tax=Hymenobacter daecheongensis DSM 21074 TaxID=1121955 RepID=A0A1M6G4E8_9BACT|nr:DUF2461 domain-containing protein [Hymenobacter daecheongensis]SHJ04793.1 TIGR02453 family protein [Hymenobacter daecheongensis DSM 21074]
MDSKFLLDFLRDLAANNHKAWMDEHRADYHRARAVFSGLVQAVLEGTQRFEPALLGLTVPETMFRINKNDRFQQSQEPYKRHMGASLTQGGRHAPRAGYFLAVQPGGETWVGAGKWHPEPAALARIRQEIHYSGPAFHALRATDDFRRHFPAGLEGDRLLRPPKGYEKDDPDIELLKFKDFVVTKSFTDAEVRHADFVARVTETFQAAQPFVRFLNEAMEE